MCACISGWCGASGRGAEGSGWCSGAGGSCCCGGAWPDHWLVRRRYQRHLLLHRLGIGAPLAHHWRSEHRVSTLVCVSAPFGSASLLSCHLIEHRSEVIGRAHGRWGEGQRGERLRVPLPGPSYYEEPVTACRDRLRGRRRGERGKNGKKTPALTSLPCLRLPCRTPHPHAQGQARSRAD